MKQKTAISELISKFEKRRDEATKFHEVVFLNAVISELQTNLTTEREQIEEAVNLAQIMIDVDLDGNAEFMIKSGADYYQQKYGDEKTTL